MSRTTRPTPAATSHRTPRPRPLDRVISRAIQTRHALPLMAVAAIARDRRDRPTAARADAALRYLRGPNHA